MFFKMKQNTKIDLLLVFTLFLPVFWEQLASVILTMISGIISTNIDTAYLNATSLVGSVFTPFTTLYACIATGSSILISQYVGADDKERTRSLFSTSTLLGFAISFVIALFIVFFHNPVLRASYPDMSENFFVNGNIYSVFYAITLPMTFFRSNMIGILRGSLNTKGPLYISLIGGVVDIALRFLLMVVFDMGIVGLGVASVITNLFFTVICAVIIAKAGTFKGCITGAFKLFRGDVAKDVVKIGTVMCVQTFLVSVGGLILSKILTTMGDAHVSAFSITTSIESLIHIIPMSLAYVAQILSGKHTGAGDEREALGISVKVTALSTVIHLIFSVLAFLFARQLVGLYTDEIQVIEIAEKTLKIGCLIMPIGWSAGNVLPAGIRGMGDVKFPAIVIVLSLFLFKIPATWYVCTVLKWGSWGRMIVYAFEFLLYAMAFLIYSIIKNKKIREKI